MQFQSSFDTPFWGSQEGNDAEFLSAKLIEPLIEVARLFGDLIHHWKHWKPLETMAGPAPKPSYLNGTWDMGHGRGDPCWAVWEMGKL